MALDRVFIDANVLYPPKLRDLFVELGRAGVIETLWSEEVQREWCDNAYDNHIEDCQKRGVAPTMTKASLQKQNTFLDLMLPKAKVCGYESLIPTIVGLTDPNDRHVVAAAVYGNANVVVSHDTRANLGPVLSARKIQLYSVDDYLMHLSSQDDLVPGILAAVRRQRADYTKEMYTPAEMIDEYERNGMAEFAKSLRFLTDHI